MLAKLFKKIFEHKLITGVVLVLILAGGYFGYKTLKSRGGGTRYILASVQKGTLIVSVSGSGQISASNQVDIKPKVSGEVVYLGMENGQEVKIGKLLLKLDTSDVQKSIEDAEINLQQTKFELEKMQGTTTESGTLRGVKEKAIDNLKKSYEDGFNNVADVFLNLPSVMTGLHDILFSYSFSPTQNNIDYYADSVKIYDERSLQYRDDTYNKYQIARAAYDQNLQDYKSASRFSSNDIIDALINETYETTKDIAEAIKSTNNLIQFYQDKLTERSLKPQTLSSTHLSTLNTYTGKTNSYLLTLLSAKNNIQTNKETLIETDFDIFNKEIQVRQAEDALYDAQKKLADCYIYSPFSGIIANVNIEKGDSVSANTAVATLVTKQHIAEIALNEVDAAKVKIGQKATLTFDALPDVTITGKVIEIDTVGTVSQGVVSYGVKIALDTEDERIKPGMSVTADIIVDAKSDVLVLPNNAIKSQAGTYYVELAEIPEEKSQEFLNNRAGVILSVQPKRQLVEVGISNDSLTEILSGLKEGDIIVSSEISSNVAQTTQTQKTQQFQIPGIGTPQMR